MLPIFSSKEVMLDFINTTDVNEMIGKKLDLGEFDFSKDGLWEIFACIFLKETDIPINAGSEITLYDKFEEGNLIDLVEGAYIQSLFNCLHTLRNHLNSEEKQSFIDLNYYLGLYEIYTFDEYLEKCENINNGKIAEPKDPPVQIRANDFESEIYTYS